MDTQKIKRIAGITTDKHDDYLNEVIPLFLGFAEEYCGQELSDTPHGVTLFVAKAAQYNMKEAGLKGRTMGEISYSYETEFPESIMKFLTPYRKMRAV